VDTQSIFRSRWSGVLVALSLLVPVWPAAAGGPASFMTHHDTIPNFAQQHTSVSAQDGPWSSASTWNPTRVPGPGDVVSIVNAVTYDSATGDVDTIGIEGGGTLRFSTGHSTILKVANLLVMPGGVLEIGTPANPVPASLTAEIVIKNKPLNAASDPNQYGTGLLSIDGVVAMHGAPRSPTFVRLARAPRAGDFAFALEQAAGDWRAGDRLVLPDSRQVPTESGSGSRNTAKRLEVRSVQSISPDGRTITFSPALQFDHPGTTDENGDGRPDYLPHVANLTRNVVVRSESRTGTRGHVLFTQRAAIDIRYAAFVDLGRTTFHDLDPTTNHIGRYSMHLHHVIGPLPTVDPQYQFRLMGNSIYEDSPVTPPQKWGITIHNSHYGLVEDNVVYNVGGAGIVTEDGSESYNVFDHNFVARVTSNGGRDEHFDSSRGIAREGVGFWFRGPNNYVRNNVAVNMGENVHDVEASYGFKYNMVQLGNVRIPNFRDADTFASGQYTTRSGNAMALLEFGNNEMYGQIQGLTLWWLCSVDFNAIANCPQSILRDTVIWHASRYSNYVFDGLRLRRSRHRGRQQPRVQECLLLWRLRHQGSPDHERGLLQHGGAEPALFPGRVHTRGGFLLQDHRRHHPPEERRPRELPVLQPARPEHGRPKQSVRRGGGPSVAKHQPGRHLDGSGEPRPAVRVRSQRPGGRQLRGVLSLAGQRALHRHPGRRARVRVCHAAGGQRMQRPPDGQPAARRPTGLRVR